MRLTVSLRGLETDGGQSELCKKTLYASDKNFNPWRRELEINGPILELDVPEEHVILHARIDLPQLGNLWVMAEVSHTTRYPVPIDFIKLAQGTYLKEYERTDEESDSPASLATRAHLAQALDYINLADERAQRGESGESVNYDDLLALSHAIRAAEDRRFEVSQKKITAAPRKEFLFGCNTHQYSDKGDWSERFTDLFNYATLPFYTGRILRKKTDTEGKLTGFTRDTSFVERVQSWCESKNMVTKGHPLFFGHEGTNPPELLELTWPEIVDVTLKHVEDSLTQFKGRIKYWDVINEAHDWANAFNLTQEQNVELAILACARAREIDPEAKLIVNSSLVFGEYVANHEVCYGPLFEQLKTPLQYLEDIIDAGADFDIVGLQLYFPARDLTAIDRLIGTFEKLGKPIHITELGVPAGTGRGEEYPMASRDVHPQIGLTRGQWRAPWNEQVQADWLERFYVQMLARESVEAISWWDMQDPGFMKTSPFLLKDGSPRSIFYRLREIRRSYIN